jgi:hypothetical protein
MEPQLAMLVPDDGEEARGGECLDAILLGIGVSLERDYRL